MALTLSRGAAARLSMPLLTFAAVALAVGTAPRSARAAAITSSTVSSTNWSGYAASAPVGSTFTDVVGSWTVPAVTGSAASDTYSATWIGLDGFGVNASTVEQTGTASQFVGGVAVYYPWVEYYPDAEVNVSTYFTISPGDSMSAEVSYKGVVPGTYDPVTNPYAGLYQVLLTLIDNTDETNPNYHGQYDGVNYNYYSATAPALASAEWITEAPGLAVGGVTTQSTLANYGTVNFTGDEAALDNGDLVSISGLDSTAIDMIDGQTGQTISLATPLTNDGEDFSTIYVGAVPEPASLGVLAIGGMALLVRRRRC